MKRSPPPLFISVTPAHGNIQPHPHSCSPPGFACFYVHAKHCEPIYIFLMNIYTHGMFPSSALLGKCVLDPAVVHCSSFMNRVCSENGLNPFIRKSSHSHSLTHSCTPCFSLWCSLSFQSMQHPACSCPLLSLSGTAGWVLSCHVHWDGSPNVVTDLPLKIKSYSMINNLHVQVFHPEHTNPHLSILV